MDARGPTSLYFAADSRISWPNNIWDSGRKLFASYSQPDVLGYAGQVALPTQALSQLIDSIDRRLLFGQGTPPTERLALITEVLERSTESYPLPVEKDFEVLYGTRHGHRIPSSFSLSHLSFVRGRAAKPSSIELPKTSAVASILGSGEAAFRQSLRTWKSSEVGGTSRSVFSAFADSLKSGSDPHSGGSPQLIGLYRVGPARTFGLVWEGKLFCCGIELRKPTSQRTITWHNDLFEICDPSTLRREEEAQPQPRPHNVTS